MDLEAGDSTTGGAAAASQAAMQRMRDNPPPSLLEPTQEAQADDTGRTPEEKAGEPTGRTPAEGTESEPTAKEAAQSADKKAGKLVSTVVLEAEKAESESKYARLLKDFGGDKEKLADALMTANKRLSDLSKTDEGADETEDTPSEEVTPAPIDRAAIEAGVAGHLKEFIKQDPDMVAMRQEFIGLREGADALLAVDAKGNPTGGELVQLARQLNTLNAKLNPKAHGLEGTFPEPDAVEAEELRTKITLLETKQATAEARHERAVEKMARLEGKWKAALKEQADFARGELEKEATSKAQPEVSEEVMAKQETKRFNAAFDKRTEGLSGDEKKFLRDRLSVIGLKVFKHGGDIEKYGDFMDEELPALKDELSRKRAGVLKEAAGHKREVAQTRVPAGNPNTRAEASVTEGSRPLTRREAERRVGQLARSVQVR